MRPFLKWYPETYSTRKLAKYFYDISYKFFDASFSPILNSIKNIA